MKAMLLAGLITLAASTVRADLLNCTLAQYTAAAGLTATVEPEAVVVTWAGDRDTELRVRFAIDKGQPLLREVAIRGKGKPWTVLGRNLRPEFHVTTGRRRNDGLHLTAMRELGVSITPEVIDREQWTSSWDAPFNVPGLPPPAGGRGGGVVPSATDREILDLPRKASEIRRASATFFANGCDVKTDGGRIEVSFPGLTLGVFSGRLLYTMYKGTNLIRQEAIAKTEEPSVAYVYAGGLGGFSADVQRVRWRDTGGDWQKYEFGGTPNSDSVPLRARNRVAIVEGESGSIAVFPPPHKFFFSRETEINLGYVWYRKTDQSSFAVGVRHAEQEEVFRSHAVSAAVIDRQMTQAKLFAEGNFALYNAPPGTWQRMAVYFYASAEPALRANEAVLAFTNGDRYRPLAGHQVMLTHIHPPFTNELMNAGTLDRQEPWIPAVRARGVNIVLMSDFHTVGNASDPGPVRFAELQQYFEASRRHSDRDFAIVPGEEPHAYLGAHWNILFPKPVYWSVVRAAGQPLVEEHPTYGKVYHVGSAADVLEMLKRENGLSWMAHQRTKFDLSAGYGTLEKIRNTDYFQSDYYTGGEFRPNVPSDLSDKRMAERVGLGALDDMNNWIADGPLRPKSLIASTDTYMKYPEDDIYPQSYVNYVRLDRVPPLDDWSSLTRVLREKEFFVSSGEILLKQFAIEGTGARRTVVAEFDWTFPLDFIEVVWGDGVGTDRQIISATDLPAFGSKRVSVPLDVAGKKWVRVAAWDSAGNGAFSQPIKLNVPASTSSR